MMRRFSLIFLLLVSACMSSRVYYGESRLSSPTLLDLRVEPLPPDPASSLLSGRFSLTNGDSSRRAFCIGLPWEVSIAWSNGPDEEFEVLGISEGVCSSEAVILEPGQSRSWDDILVYSQKGTVEALRITVRVYEFKPGSKPKRRYFYELSTSWPSAT